MIKARVSISDSIKLKYGFRPEQDLSKYRKREVMQGIDVEFEHTDDPREALKIAIDHLNELPDYYTRLDEMESKALNKAKLKPVGSVTTRTDGRKYKKVADGKWELVTDEKKEDKQPESTAEEPAKQEPKKDDKKKGQSQTVIAVKNAIKGLIDAMADFVANRGGEEKVAGTVERLGEDVKRK